MLFMHSSVDGYLECFHFLAVVSNAAMNTHVRTCFYVDMFSSG